jgi:hypothetical protein
MTVRQHWVWNEIISLVGLLRDYFQVLRKPPVTFEARTLSTCLKIKFLLHMKRCVSIAEISWFLLFGEIVTELFETRKYAPWAKFRGFLNVKSRWYVSPSLCCRGLNSTCMFLETSLWFGCKGKEQLTYFGGSLSNQVKLSCNSQ